VEICWLRAESHLASIPGLVQYIRQEHRAMVGETVLEFTKKLKAVDAEIERVRRPFWGVGKLRYVFGDTAALIRDLEEWCHRLDHSHLRNTLTFEEEREVREMSGLSARIMAGNLLQSHVPPGSTSETRLARRFLPAPSEIQRLEAGSQVLRRLLLAPQGRGPVQVRPAYAAYGSSRTGWGGQADCAHSGFVRQNTPTACQDCGSFMPRYINKCGACGLRLCNRCMHNRN
jgi:hypothetical protein